VNVFGFLYDIETGQLLLVEEKPGDPTAPLAPLGDSSR
jgi:hypothetical protein